MGEKITRVNCFIVILSIVCFSIGCAGAFITGAGFGKPRNIEHSGRDREHGRQMGRASELLESIDGNLGGIQDGLGRIKIHLGQDAGELRGLAQRLRVIADEVSEMEKYLVRIRGELGYFREYYDYFNRSLINKNSGH